MDKGLAARYFKRSADHGNSLSQFVYGQCLTTRLVHSFKLSADQGDPHALVRCALVCTNGEGVAIDKTCAAHYFKMTADQADKTGETMYAYCLENGDGVVMDQSLAVQY
jgi:TPR repeat protein